MFLCSGVRGDGRRSGIGVYQVSEGGSGKINLMNRKSFQMTHSER